MRSYAYIVHIYNAKVRSEVNMQERRMTGLQFVTITHWILKTSMADTYQDLGLSPEVGQEF